MGHRWCSHCFQGCKTLRASAFISCSTCGKILGEIREQKSRVMKRKKRRQKVIGLADIAVVDNNSNSFNNCIDFAVKIQAH